MTGDRDTITVNHPQLGIWQLECKASSRLLFTENETNDRHIFGTANATAFVKDGINDFVLNGRTAAVNPAKAGTKAAAYHLLDIPAEDSPTVRLRLRRAGLDDPAFAEADAFTT